MSQREDEIESEDFSEYNDSIDENTVNSNSSCENDVETGDIT